MNILFKAARPLTIEQARRMQTWEPQELGSKLVAMLKAKRILRRIEKSESTKRLYGQSRPTNMGSI